MHIPTIALGLTAALGLVSASPIEARQQSNCHHTLKVDKKPWTICTNTLFEGPTTFTQSKLNYTTYEACFNYCGKQAGTLAANFFADPGNGDNYCYCAQSYTGTTPAEFNWVGYPKKSSG